jgi:uncharacterized protein YjbI with pentapeptide repeats
MTNLFEECGERLVRLILLAASASVLACAQDTACPIPPGNENDFHGQTLVNANFSYRDLTNANFSNATLVAPFFAYANLTNANFEGAVFAGGSSDTPAVADFSFANLTNTCFAHARFERATYFTAANLTCADFSHVDLSNKNAIFGESPLDFDRAENKCRPTFRSSTMDCEFVGDWRYLDLADADVKVCLSQLTGRDLSGAKLAGVNLSGANLDGTKFVKADLSQAIFDNASLRGADLSRAMLLGAHMDHVNFTGASLYHAFLSNDTPTGITNAASVRQSHLKNVNLSYAQLSGVAFNYSNFYGDDSNPNDICKTVVPPNQCSKPSNGNNYEGFTCRCSSAHGAVMTKTDFSGAYLYGVDFTEAQGQGVNFTEAVLTGANLKGAVISSDPRSGFKSTFFRSFLQGTDLKGTQLKDVPDLTDAFVDFSSSGNNLYIVLDGTNHNNFPCPDCSPLKGKDVCVLVNYPLPTQVPEGDVELKCPNGSIGDCGVQSGSNEKWKSGITDLSKPPAGVPHAWYENDSTYIPAPEDPRSICDGEGSDSAIIFW